MPRAKSEEKEAHQHSWFTGSDESHQLCSCGCVLVSGIEWKRRKQEWDNYYKSVRDTNSYKRFFIQKEAYSKGDMVTVKKLAEEARKELEEKCILVKGEWEEKREMWLEKPHYPDPITWGKYRISE